MDMYIVLTAALLFCFRTYTCQCPDAWVLFKGSCYLFSHEDKTFTDSEHFCLQHQSHLVKIDNSDEDNFLKSHSSDLKDLQRQFNANRWIGLTDADIEGVWKWTDGSSADFINWSPGEPDGHKTQDCSILYTGYQYGWIDVGCGELYRPICEKAVSGCQPDSGAIVG